MTPYRLTHLISQAELAAEERRLVQVLGAGGYPVHDLVLTSVAAQAVVRDLCERAHDLGIRFLEKAWGFTRDGIEVVFGFESDDDAAQFRLVL